MHGHSHDLGHELPSRVPIRAVRAGQELKSTVTGPEGQHVYQILSVTALGTTESASQMKTHWISTGVAIDRNRRADFA